MSGSAATEFTSVQSQYEVQVAGDLERNDAEQKRIRAEIDTLQGQLETLERDHALLLGVQRVFAEGARPGAVRGAKASAKKSAKPSAKAGTAGKQPSLAQLLGTLLAAHGEPRSAAEISAELAADHPRRNSNVNVVRNALELLVAKSQAHRSKQNNSVFYTYAGPDAAPASD